MGPYDLWPPSQAAEIKEPAAGLYAFFPSSICRKAMLASGRKSPSARPKGV